MSQGTVVQGRIVPLPPLVVNQIAAGEVIERPASVVKELLDNAIDAGATRITVDLEQGGIELVRITDDGVGMTEQDLPLALAPHATSKIRATADLDHIATMGFRGEALASIVSVSRLTIRSRTAEMVGAIMIEAEGDTRSPIQPAAGPVGTCITVRNLFFNTPARRKFLRTPTTERGWCLDIVRSLAMSHPAIGFTVTVDGRSALELPPGSSPRQRVIDVLGRELESQLIEVSADEFDDSRVGGAGRGGLTLWGLIGLPSLARATARQQHVFLNGRPIRDKTIQHALREAYRGLIEPGRYPTCAVMIEMDPGSVDVNVHPAKAEVRFRDSSMVHGSILRTIREALRAADLTPSVMGGVGRGFGSGMGQHGGGILPPGGGESAATESAGSFADYLRETGGAGGVPQGRISYEGAGGAGAGAGAAAGPEGGHPAAETRPTHGFVPRPAPRILQVHKSFLVTEDEHGMVIVDQHALHERVMFEQLLGRIAQGNLESQRLLMPATIEAGTAQLEALTDLAPLLTRLGIAAEPMGPTTIAVQSFPTFLFERGVEPGPFLTELLEKAEAETFAPESEAALHEVLDMMACKAAVKAGDRLSEEELKELLTLRDSVERSSNCPHGRPTSIRLTINELERRFGRS